MPSIPFLRVMRMLSTANYDLYGRRKYPDRDDAVLYLFSHPRRPMLGFPVVHQRVANKHYQRLKRILQEFEDEENEGD